MAYGGRQNAAFDEDSEESSSSSDDEIPPPPPPDGFTGVFAAGAAVASTSAARPWAAPASESSPYANHEPHSSTGLPPGWEEHTDDDTGLLYYHNEASVCPPS